GKRAERVGATAQIRTVRRVHNHSFASSVNELKFRSMAGGITTTTGPLRPGPSLLSGRLKRLREEQSGGSSSNGVDAGGKMETRPALPDHAKPRPPDGQLQSDGSTVEEERSTVDDGEGREEGERPALTLRSLLEWQIRPMVSKDVRNRMRPPVDED
ncbi:hypothetical protein PFISCL1PPCAC_8193, partial [Pristionchus fissidentatus]